MQSDLALEAVNLGKTFKTYRRPIHKPLSRIPGFSKLGGEFQALKSINLTIKQGECVAILGPNGSGKSTFLRMVSGTMAPTRGQLSIRGSVAGILELGAGFLPDLTGRENAVLNAMIAGLSERDAVKRLPWIADFADIGDYMDRPVRSYSSGMFVRLAFAVAAAATPDILVIDEALAVGDVAFQQKCHVHMRTAMEGSTRLFVSHDVSRLSSICERSVVLHQGQIVFDGPTERGVVEYLKLSHERSAKKANVGLEASGPRELDIVGVAIDVMGKPVKDIEPGDTVNVEIDIDNNIGSVGLAYGAIWSDDTGQAVISSNSTLDGDDVPSLVHGRQTLRFRFDWPDIRSGGYSLTLGIGSLAGEGSPQKLQCWVHGCAKLQCVNTKDIHGIFHAKLTRS